MCKPESKLNYLLEKEILTHDTRNPPTYHCPIPRTERDKGSFVIHNLLQLIQWAQMKSLHHINQENIYTKVMFKVIYCKN